MDRISQLHGIDPYVLMGLRNSAGDADVKRAYKRCALRCHPDKFVNKSEALRNEAKTRFERLTAARDVLLDSTARAAYDHATHRCPRCPYNQFCAVGPDGIWRARCAKCSPIVQPTPIDATVMRACYNVQTKMQKLNQTITALDAIIRKHSTTARTLKRKRKKYDLGLQRRSCRDHARSKTGDCISRVQEFGGHQRRPGASRCRNKRTLVCSVITTEWCCLRSNTAHLL